MQIGEGEGDPGTSWLEESGGSYLSRHTDANNNEFGASDWNVCIVYWGKVFGKGLDKKVKKAVVKPEEPTPQPEPEPEEVKEEVKQEE